MSVLANLGDRLLVIYDGYCGLCNSSVGWFLRRDRLDRLRFAPSDSPQIAAILAAHYVPAQPAPPIPDSILVVRNAETPLQQIFANSDAVAAILDELPSPWPFFARLLRCIPRPLRDFGYRIIARWRYKIWGRYTTCPLPTAQERNHFL